MQTGRLVPSANRPDTTRAAGVKVTAGFPLPASARRVAEKRARRHREQAVQAWLRSLDR